MTQPMDDLTLPEPWADTLHGWAYTAEQMREYAKQAVEADRAKVKPIDSKNDTDCAYAYAEGWNCAIHARSQA